MGNAYGKSMEEIGWGSGKNLRVGQYKGKCPNCKLVLAEFDKDKCPHCGAAIEEAIKCHR